MENDSGFHRKKSIKSLRKELFSKNLQKCNVKQLIQQKTIVFKTINIIRYYRFHNMFYHKVLLLVQYLRNS